MPQKVKLILNPMADMGRAWKVAGALRAITKGFHGEVTWTGTVYPGHAIELAKQAAAEGCDLVIAMGGDGTAHEVINGLMQVPEAKRPIFGIVPIGSGNDFGFINNMPKKPDHALAHILKAENVQPVDIGLMTDENGQKEYFDNTLGIGFDAIVTIRSHKLPIVKGFLMYLTAVIQTIVLNHNPAKMKFVTEKQTWEDEALMVTVCNGPREGGGFMIAPDAKINDGILNFAVVRNVSRLTMFRLVPEFMNGTHTRFKQIQMGECQKISITSDKPMYIHADGEIFTSFGSNLKKIQIEVLPKALRVVQG